MRRSKAVAILASLVISATWSANVPAGASDLSCRGGTRAPASFYSYDAETRLWLNVSRPRFDTSDGLQRWEVWLLAMDRSPGGPGR